MAPFEQLTPLQPEQVDDLPIRGFSWSPYRSRRSSTKDRETRIRERAYLLWEGAGRPVGQQEMHWLMAVEEVDSEIERENARR